MKKGSDSFSVFVRIRPPFENDKPQTTSRKPWNVLTVKNDNIWITEPHLLREYSYNFTGVFSEKAQNSQVYQEAVSPLVDALFEGFNSTVFAYGMTGAGKTHTMVGSACIPTSNELGVTFMALGECFARDNTLKVSVSYLEIYNEKIRDLLGIVNNKGLMVVEDPAKGVTVPDLAEFPVSNLSQVQQLLISGNGRRTMAPTSANVFSTRSHTILQVTVEQKASATENLVSKMSLIDLAGSERAAATANRGQRMVEGANINRSLLALGNCINMLSDDKKQGQFVPYRDSKLTRLLKDSLGGNTKTVMLACISPSSLAIEETLNTLKYAARAQKIKKEIKRNYQETELHIHEYKDIINNLKQEIETLKIQLSRQDSNVNEEPSVDVTDDTLPLTVEPDQGNVDMLSNILMKNFEDHWEIRQSISEVDNLNTENEAKIKILASQVKIHSNNAVRSDEISKNIRSIQQNIKDNETVKNKMLDNLYKNIKQKNECQKQLGEIQYSKRKDILELQIAMRNLKMEKYDLHIQNLQMKQDAIETQKKSEEKDRIIEEMKQQLEQMKSQLKPEEPSIDMSLVFKHESPVNVLSHESPEKIESDDENFIKSVIDSYKSVGKQSKIQDFRPNSTETRKGMLAMSLAEARCASKINKQMEQESSTLRFLNDYIPSANENRSNTPRAVNDQRANTPRMENEQKVNTPRVLQQANNRIQERENTQHSLKANNKVAKSRPTFSKGAFSNLHVSTSNKSPRMTPRTNSVGRSRTENNLDPRRRTEVQYNKQPNSMRRYSQITSKSRRQSNKRLIPKSENTPPTQKRLLTTSLNSKLLSPAEASNIVRNSWNLRQKTVVPNVAISLIKQSF